MNLNRTDIITTGIFSSGLCGFLAGAFAASASGGNVDIATGLLLSPIAVTSFAMAACAVREGVESALENGRVRREFGIG